MRRPEILICLALAACGGSSHATTTSTTRPPTVTVTTPQTVTAKAAPAKPGGGIRYCSPKDLGIHFAGSQGAAGTTYSQFAFVNVTAAPCRLNGYPGVSAYTSAGTRIPIPVARDTSRAPHPVLLAPKRAAGFLLETGNGAGGPCYTASILRFIPPNDYAYEQIAHRQQICGQRALVSAVGTR